VKINTLDFSWLKRLSSLIERVHERSINLFLFYVTLCTYIQTRFQFLQIFLYVWLGSELFKGFLFDVAMLLKWPFLSLIVSSCWPT